MAYIYMNITRAQRRKVRRLAWPAFCSVFFLILAYTGIVGWQLFQQLDETVTHNFAVLRQEVPSKVYAQPLLLYPGLNIKDAGVIAQLNRLDYQQVSGAVQLPGEYRYEPRSGLLEIYLRSFTHPTHIEEEKPVRLILQTDQIKRIENPQDKAALRSLALEPEMIAALYGPMWKERRVVRLEDVPPLLIKAILAAEDHRFFAHYGIDFRGILRAAKANLQAGQIVQGGSTITQQLVKNLFLTQERTFTRKLLEAATAVVIENRYSKSDILTSYINETYLGQRGARGIFGIWEAAHLYFGKEPQDLTLGEMALLAGLVRAPNYYAPHKHRERALQRRNNILRQMLKLGYISKAEYQAASAEDLQLHELSIKDTAAPYFIDFIKKEQEKSYSAKTLATEGLHIFTSLDMHLQQIAEETLVDGLHKLEKQHPQLRRQEPEKQLQACLIALEPQTGEIKALVGGRDYHVSQFNRATQARRQLGSVFKPFVYLAALEQERRFQDGRFLPTTLIEDQAFTWHYNDTESWTPANYEDRYLGTVTLRQALEKSLNAATVRVAQTIGLDPILQMAKTLGITSPLPRYPSVILGAAEVTPLEVTQAFAVLANQGIKAAPTAVSAVTDRHGEILARHLMHFEQVIPPQTAYTVTHMLQGVLKRGTGSRARKEGFDRPAAGKTGTTDDYADAWFVGYTPELVAVVWVGFDDSNESLGLSSGKAALPIWTAFMKRATAGVPIRDFTPPSGVSLVDIDPATGLRATPHCPLTVTEVFFAGEEPESPCHHHDPTVVATFINQEETPPVEDNQYDSTGVATTFFNTEETPPVEDIPHDSTGVETSTNREETLPVEDNQPKTNEFSERVTEPLPSEPSDYYELARSSFLRRHYQEALDLLTQAEVSFGDDVARQGEVYTLRGMIYEELGDAERAQLAYKRARRFTPQNLSALSGLSRSELDAPSDTWEREIFPESEDPELSRHRQLEPPESWDDQDW